MWKLLGVIAVAVLAVPALHIATPAPRVEANDTPKAAFLKKCIRDVTKRACTAPPEARAKT